MITREDIILSMKMPGITEAQLLEAFSKMSNKALAEKYTEVTGIIIEVAGSGIFIIRH